MTGDGAADVAVLIPARNEAASIGRCLEHVLEQDIGRDHLEVIVVDGCSNDGTGEIAAAILESSGLRRWVVYRNPAGSTPSNLNAGLALVRAQIVCRVDARSLIPPEYVRTCDDALVSRPEVTVVGGAQVAVPRSESNRDEGIARALNNRYGMGLSRYRRGASSGQADTVYLGAFRTAQLRGVGGWDERLPTNQDFELNRRLEGYGMVWFESGLEVGYLARPSLAGLWVQYRRFGRGKVRYWELTGDRPRPRQWALLGASAFAAPGVLVALVAPGRRARRAVALSFAAIGSLALIDHFGAREDPPRYETRVWGVLASAVVGLGWLSGVAEGLARK